MTQPPYVPPRDDDSSPDYTWPPAQESSTPAYTEATYVEPVSSVSVNDDYTTGTRSTSDVAKEQAGTVKDTAAEQGQHVAGVAKEQAGVVKDTAVEQGQHVAGVAKDQAGAVRDSAVEQGQYVAEVAKDQVGKVASEASTHVKDLLAEGLSEVRSQLGSQQKRLATGVHSLADEVGSMASKSDKSGPVTDYAHEIARRGGELAHWLDNAEPSEVLDSLRSFARRRPAVFLVASALAGTLAGRVTRGAVANKRDESQPAQLTTTTTTTSPQRFSGEYSTTGYQDTQVPARESYVVDDATLPYSGTGNDGITR